MEEEKSVESLFGKAAIVIYERVWNRSKTNLLMTVYKWKYWAHLLVPGFVRGIVVVHFQHALVAQLTLVHLQREKGKHHQTEDGQRHYFRQLLERMQQCVNDGLQT